MKIDSDIDALQAEKAEIECVLKKHTQKLNPKFELKLKRNSGRTVKID